MTSTQTWGEVLQAYANDPKNGDTVVAVLDHPDYTLAGLVDAFLGDKIFSSDLDQIVILETEADDITPELWVKLVTYNGDHDCVNEFVNQSEYYDDLQAHLTDLSWDAQVAFLAPLFEDGAGDEAQYLMNVVAASLKWPEPLIEVVQAIDQLGDISDSYICWPAWKRLVKLASDYNPPL